MPYFFFALLFWTRLYVAKVYGCNRNIKCHFIYSCTQARTYTLKICWKGRKMFTVTRNLLTIFRLQLLRIFTKTNVLAKLLSLLFELTRNSANINTCVCINLLSLQFLSCKECCSVERPFIKLQKYHGCQRDSVIYFLW